MISSREKKAVECSVLEAIMRGTSSRMMEVDNDHNIVYVNEAVKEVLLEVEEDIQKQLPAISVAG